MLVLSTFVILVAAGAQPVARQGFADSCYHYRPAAVSLTGRLIQRTLPGPPNYQSIARGDRPQVVDLLILDAPICTIARSEEHTSELQSRLHLVCRLLLEKKKNKHEIL